MQSVFFIALFSLVFLMFSSLTAGMSKNIMQQHLEKIEETKKMFSDIETALTLIVFKEKTAAGKAVVDLSDSDLIDLGGNFLPKHTSYTSNELKRDAWKHTIFLLRTVKHETIWGASGGQYAKAPVSTFMLVSAGPNGIYDMFESLGVDINNPNLTENQIKMTDITDKGIVGDDIVVRFSNYDSMLNIWQRVEDLDVMVRNIAVAYYSSLLDAFSPLIQLSQRDVRYGKLDENIFNTIDLTSAYSGFDDFDDTDSGNISEAWNDETTDIYKILAGGTTSDGTDYTGFRLAKDYDNEFKLDNNSTENSAKNNEFKNKYPEEFVYPSFDIVVKDSSGYTLPVAQQGLQNIGVNNIESLDPFSGVGVNEGVLDYDYDESKPNEIILKRTITTLNNDKWQIKKETKINVNN